MREDRQNRQGNADRYGNRHLPPSAVDDPVQRAEHGRPKNRRYKEPESGVGELALLGACLPWLEVPDLEQERAGDCQFDRDRRLEELNGDFHARIIRGATTRTMRSRAAATRGDGQRGTTRRVERAASAETTVPTMRGP